MSDPEGKDCCRCRNAHWEDLGMHGVRRLVRGKGSCGHSSFWVVIILVSLALVIYQTLGCVVHYLTYPTITDYQIIQPTIETSPALTLCNLNHWRLSKLHDKGWLGSLISLYSQKHSKQPRFGSNITSTNAFTSTGHSAEDMVLKCVHGSHDCKHSNFTLVFTEHGLCYTFPRLGQYQLDLILNAEEYEYCELTNQRVGVLIIIHEANSSPFLSPTYVMTSPGMHSRIEIQSSRVSHSDVRYRVCTEVNGYTQSSCQAACLYQLVVDRCGCTPYWSLKHQSAHFDVSTCSLHSHLNCVQRQVSELTTDSLVSICHCDTSCEYTVYTASTSMSYISTRDYKHYVSDKQYYSVANSLLQAENIRARTYGKGINQHILAFSRSLEDFRYQVDTLKRNLQQVQQNVNGLMEQMYKRTWFHYHVGLIGIEKLFKHGFLPQWKTVDVQFLQPLVAGFQAVLFSYENAVNKLDMTSPSEVAMRRTMYLGVDERLSVGMELAIQGLENFTKVYYSLLDMKPSSPYIVTPERRYDASLLPIEATREVAGVLRAQFTAISDLLARYMEQILALKNILKDLYVSPSGLNRTAYDVAKETLRRTGVDLQNHVELFREKAVRRLQEIVESRSAHFKRQNETLFGSWTRLAAGLAETVSRLELVSLDQYPPLVELGQDGELYAGRADKPLSDLAQSALSNVVLDGVRLLVGRIARMKERSESVASLWQRFEEHLLATWRTMLADQSLKDFYAKLNADVKNVVQNPTSSNNLRAVFAHNKMLGKSSLEIGSLDPDEFFVLLNADFPTTSMRTKQNEIRDAIGQFRRLTDVSLQLQDFDRQLRQSYDNIRDIFQEFTRRTTLDENFIQKNIISLSIKMAADGHERITETSAYTIYHLLRDVGILMLLFLGASIMTFFEIIDILVTCICCRRSSNHNDKHSDVIKSPSPPDTLPTSTRHVTFQFPTENHIGSPTKPALKRPKLEYYPGEIDLQTDIADTHTEIL